MADCVQKTYSFYFYAYVVESNDMTKKKEKVALSSVFASLGLTGIKLVVGLLTGSMGILSEAAHSALDLGAAALTYVAVRVSDQPPDDDHPYGHGKIESVSAFIETGLLFLTSAWIIFESVKRLTSQTIEIEVAWYSFAVVIFAIAVDYSRSKALYKVAIETKSQALEADGLHFKSDIYSSAVVLIGLVLFKLGFHSADAFAAIGVSLFVLHAGYQLGKRTFNVLTDAAPVGILPKLKEIITKVDGVFSIERLRVRPVGPDLFIDLILNVSRTVPLEQVEKITKSVQEKIKIEIPEADIVVHVNPIALSNENIVERIHTIAVNHGLRTHNVEVLDAAKNKVVNFDLEINENLTLEEAHGKAEHIERTIKSEFGNETDVAIHLDPAKSSAETSIDLNEHDREEIIKMIMNIPEKFEHFSTPHKINIQKTNEQVVVSLHGVVDPKTKLKDVHTLSHNIEDWIKKNISSVSKAFCHLEPRRCD
jgi:cation diffusion facilitator family transporter